MTTLESFVRSLKWYQFYSMVTLEQEQWLNHLNDSNSIEIFPYDELAGEKFERIKRLLVSVLGEGQEILHRGSSSLKISGQKEIDIYISVAPIIFNSILPTLEQVFGPPRSHYPLERVCYVAAVDGTKVEIFVINNESIGWFDSIRFETYLQQNPETLNEYRILKIESAGLSTREYYRKKIEFINKILSIQEK